MNRREVLTKAPLLIAGVSPLLRSASAQQTASLNTTVLNSMSAKLSPILPRVINKTFTRADIGVIGNQFQGLINEFERVNFDANFRNLVLRFRGTDPHFTENYVANMVWTNMRASVPTLPFSYVDSIFKKMPQYNPALPASKLQSIITSTLNQLAIQGLIPWLAQARGYMFEIYENYNPVYAQEVPDWCGIVLRILFILAQALLIASLGCWLTIVFEEICPVIKVLGYLVAILAGMLKAFLCGF